MRWLHRIKIRTRLFLVLMVVIAPLVVLTVLTVITQNRAIDFGQKEIYGVWYNRNLMDLMYAVQ
ncbi:MAG: hypothetical protein KDK34_04315, partial [Leptospiraceae bacterium]|nr:hypothetical protein [Leptospiraceae bacterium]